MLRLLFLCENELCCNRTEAAFFVHGFGCALLIFGGIFMNGNCLFAQADDAALELASKIQQKVYINNSRSGNAELLPIIVHSSLYNSDIKTMISELRSGENRPTGNFEKIIIADCVEFADYVAKKANNILGTEIELSLPYYKSKRSGRALEEKSPTERCVLIFAVRYKKQMDK